MTARCRLMTSCALTAAELHILTVTVYAVWRQSACLNNKGFPVRRTNQDISPNNKHHVWSPNMLRLLLSSFNSRSQVMHIVIFVSDNGLLPVRAKPYLNQRWLIVNQTPRNKLYFILKSFHLGKCIWKVVCKMSTIWLGLNFVNSLRPSDAYMRR